MSETLERIKKDTITALKGKDALKVSTLRMAQAAAKNKEIEKRSTLDEAEVQAVLSTMVKQRKDSFDQFVAGGRSDLAEKEAAEIDILKVYMPQELSRDELVDLVRNVIDTESGFGRTLTIKDQGLIIRSAKQIVANKNMRADGAILSEVVRKHLTV